MKQLIFFCIVPAILFTSCASHRYIYAPTAANLPYFTEKNQFQSSLLYSGNGGDEKGNGMDLNTAYSCGENWAITAGYFYRKEFGKDVLRNVFDSTYIEYTRNLGMAGAGYFIPLNTKKTITFNLYGSTIFGKFRQEESGTKDSAFVSRYHNNDITGFSIQPSIHFMPGKYFHFAIFFKNSWIHFGGLSTNFLQEEYAYFDYGKLDNRTRSFFESGYNIQFGIPEVRWLKLEHSVSICRNSYAIGDRLRSRWASASIGLNFQFSRSNR